MAHVVHEGGAKDQRHDAVALELANQLRRVVQEREGMILLKLATVRPAEGAPGPTWWAEWDYSQTHLRIDGA